MPTHSTSAYKDGHKWIVFCTKCGQEEPIGECSERYLKNGLYHVDKEVDVADTARYVSGIAKSAV